MNIVTSALGRYEAIGNPDDADILVGHSFGTMTDDGSVNRQLALAILETADGRPIVVDRNLAHAFPGNTDRIDHVVDGPIANAAGKGVGSWGTLVEAKQFMETNALVRPMMIAQSHHIGRIAMQAEKLGMDAIIPAGMPDTFDWSSRQLWTRSNVFWLPREIGGSVALRLQGKL